MYTLYYDKTCPVCSSFASILRRKIPSDRLSLLSLDEGSVEFKLITDKGKVLRGNDVIDELARAFPQITSYFSLLPRSFQTKALHTVVKAGSFIRKVSRPGGCNCKK